MKKHIFYYLTFIFFATSLGSCKKDNNEPTPVIIKDAGADIVNVDKFWVTLNADSLKYGESGEWVVEKGLVDDKVYFEDCKSPKTIFHGLPGEKYLLKWKVLLNTKYYQDTVHVNFNPIKVKIIKDGLDHYSTRIGLNVEGPYQGKWTISGDCQHYESTQLCGVEVPKENFPSIIAYGNENGTINAKWAITYGSVSFSDSISFKTGNYNEYEALEDIGIINYPQHYSTENGHVVEIYLGADGKGWAFERFEEFPALRALKYLRKLILSGDGIHNFSSSIPLYYKDLTYLNLGGNYINQIPANIGELKKLEFLDLSNPQDDNEISQIPESFGNLGSLKYLDLSSNSITELPSTFGNLKKLETLLMWGSILNSLPTSFGNLNSLKKFNLNGIRNNLPESFSQLTNLEDFFAGGTSAVTKLPENIGNLKRLKIFNYQGDLHIETLPNSFCDLDSLNVFDLWSNLKELPINFGNLKSLETLILHGNLKELPQSFTNLKTLKYFSVTSPKSNNPVFVLPNDIDKLINLDGIAIEHTNLYSVPNSIGRIPRLREISFWDCALDSVPSSIGDLKYLSGLNFVGNNLSKIPDNFKNLKGLNVINLAENKNLAWQIDQIRDWKISTEVIY